MIGRRLVNGVETSSVASDDRGLQYGDGLFETMAVVDGEVRHFKRHVARVKASCDRLGIPMPAASAIERDCEVALQGMASATIKLMLTRGPGPRGYRPPKDPSVTRIVISSAARNPSAADEKGLVLRVCDTRLGLNPALAGMKHLNRLEQVLACSEWDDPTISEGLMLSMDGRLVCATASNVFLVRDGVLHTPDIRDCGVAGVMREIVIETARVEGTDVVIGDLTLADLASAQEVFLTNAVTGPRPVAQVLGHSRWEPGPVTLALAANPRVIRP
jgi:4-amino-4-deoxychorismate lyase